MEDAPISKRRRVIPSPSPTPEPDSDVGDGSDGEGELDVEPTTPDTSPAPRRRGKSLPIHDVGPAEDDVEEEEDYGDREGEEAYPAEDDDNNDPSPFHDPHMAARNLLAALGGSRKHEKYFLCDYMRIYALLTHCTGTLLTSRRQRGSFLAL